MTDTRSGRLVIATVLLACAHATARTVIDSKTVLVVSQNEPLPVRKAAADLASDLRAVLGTTPRIETTPPAAGSAIVVGLRDNVPPSIARPTTAETPVASSDAHTVVLTGSDVRGVIYAVYDFSREQLGVDPLYWWTDHPPQRKARIVIPSGYRATSPQPRFRYRGWFINDEDLLTGWKPAAPGVTRISLEVWDRIFEALLRLKGNMIVPGTFIFPDEPQVRAAGDRGLIITQHHIEVLGTNTWRWPPDQPYSFADFPRLLINAWTNSMRTYPKNQEVIWTVGYRGRHDRAFWLDDNSIPPTDEARADAIRKAIDEQIRIVRAERPNPRFIMNAWMEAVPLIRSGLLKLPAGVTLVWPDNGHGIIQDQGRIRPGQGVYYHTAMHDFVANQLTEMVPLPRIQREIGRAGRAGADEYLLVNVSDVRPYPLTTRAAMEIAAGVRDWTSDEYLLRWCREQFGARAAAAMAAYYRAYFDAPGRYGPAEHETLADNAYHNYMRFVFVSLIKGRPELSEGHVKVRDWDRFIESVGGAAREAEPRWRSARALAMNAARLIPPERRDFFQSHVLTQLEIHELSNRALLRAVEAWTDRPHAAAKLDSTIRDLNGVLAAFKAAEYGKWKGFYDQDRFVTVRRSLAFAQMAASAVAGGKVEPADLEPLPTDAYLWLKSYQSERWVPVE